MSTPLPPFALERYFARWEFRARYLLCSSDIEGWPMAELLALADEDCQERWAALTLGYTEYSGLPALRQEVARLYRHVSAEEVLMTAGAEEAIYLTLPLLAGAGDHAIVTWPGYQSLYELPRAAGAEVSRWELRPENRWRPDVGELRRLVQPNTKLIVVNFPNNPTGALPDHETWDQILDIARDTGAWLFSDEVYRESEHAPAYRLPAAVDCYRKGISLGVMSKSYGLAGLRIGWIASQDAGLLERAGMRKDYTSIANSAPSEVLALIALRAREAVLARSLSILKSNMAVAEAFFSRQAGRVSWIRPRAGAIGFPKLEVAGERVEAFAARLVERTGTLILPASVFGYEGNHFRLGFGRLNFEAALGVLEAELGAQKAE